MSRRTAIWLYLASMIVPAAACGGGTTAPPAQDGGTLRDGGALLDGGAPQDGGSPLDGGAAPDGGATMDGGAQTVAEAMVGPAGGTLTGTGITMSIPAGALATPTMIRITQTTVAPPLPTGASAVGPIFKFEPAGSQFTQDVTVTFTVDRARVPSPVPAGGGLVAFHASEGASAFTAVGYAGASATTVSGTIRSFSVGCPAFVPCGSRLGCGACVADGACTSCGDTCVARTNTCPGGQGEGATPVQSIESCPACSASTCGACVADSSCAWCERYVVGQSSCQAASGSCTGGSNPSKVTAANQCIAITEVTISPSSPAQMLSDSRATFTATSAATNTAGRFVDDILWSASSGRFECMPAPCATLTHTSGQGVVFVAPIVEAATTVTLTARSRLDPTKSASVQVPVTSARVTGVTVTANPTTIADRSPGNTTQVTATVMGTPTFSGDVTWSVSLFGNGGPGVLSSTTSASGQAITYTAPMNNGGDTTIMLRATSVADPSKSGEVSINVTQPAQTACSTVLNSAAVGTRPHGNKGLLTLHTDGYLYWPTFQSNQVHRVKTDGSLFQVVAPSENGPSNVAFFADAVNWIGNGRIRRRTFADLASTSAPVVTTVAPWITGLGGPENLAADSTHLYVVSSLEAGQLQRINLEPSAQPLVGDLRNPTRVVLGETHAYWAEHTYQSSIVDGGVQEAGSTLHRIIKDGSLAREAFLSYEDSRAGLAPGRTFGIGEFLTDATHLYVAVSDGGRGHRILRKPLSGGAFTTIVQRCRRTNSDGQLVQPQCPDPPPAPGIDTAIEHIALDATHVYWMEGRLQNPAAVMRAAKEGPSDQVPTQVTQLQFSGGGIAVDATHVYFHSFEELCKVPKP